MSSISGKKVAILVDNYFEEAELTGPLEALESEGAEVEIIATGAINDEVQGLQHIDKGHTFTIDKTIDEANIDDYDALVLPGGAINADQLRVKDKALEWINRILDKNKPLAAICHAPWALINAGVADGRRLTSYPTIKDDLVNAGTDWADDEVVIDGNLITSRKPDDIPAFNQALITMLQAA